MSRPDDNYPIFVLLNDTHKRATRGGWAPTRFSFDIRYQFLNQDIPPKHHCRGAKQWNLVSCFEKIPSQKKQHSPLKTVLPKGKVVSQPPFFTGYRAHWHRRHFLKKPCESAPRNSSKSQSWRGDVKSVLLTHICLQHVALTSKMSMFGLSFLNRFHFPHANIYDIWRSRLTEKHIQYCNGTYQSPRESCENTRDLHMFTFILLVTNVYSFFEGLLGLFAIFTMNVV